MSISRRSFIKNTTLVTAALPLIHQNTFSSEYTNDSLPKIHIFSKHLQFLDYEAMAQKAKEIGFDGIDLTIRPQGHVLPEKVDVDLPKVVAAMKKVGFRPSLFCTAVEDAQKEIDKKLLETAAKYGFTHYRMNWYRFPSDQNMPEAIESFRKKMVGLSDLNKKLNLKGCYQNHAGVMLGGSVWEIWNILQGTNPQHMGVQYDIRHATVEGGLNWPNGVKLLHSAIKTVVLKDFHWEKINGKWITKNVPLGEGMVDFKGYFKLLKQYKVDVPFCLHLEYPELGGANNGAFKITVEPEVVYKAMKRDLEKARQLWL
jgi:sugar phosphate isomerase/epimerase